ncbi:hypothetical protein JHK85_009994 [Glycine max]|nr:hypothetical protein JHK85_009994 [Glycine max]
MRFLKAIHLVISHEHKYTRKLYPNPFLGHLELASYAKSKNKNGEVATYSRQNFIQTIQNVKCINAKFSNDGSKLMATKSNLFISVYDCRTAKEIWAFEVPIAITATLSPNGTYFQTF